MTHPAILKVNELYDEPGDMSDAATALLTAVNLARTERTACARTAIQLFGDGSQAYCAAVYLADRKLADDLDAALSAYERDVEADDELLEVAYVMAAE